MQVKRRRVMALLAYLAVTGQRHSREKLIDLIYHGQALSLTGNDFRQRLSNLKSLIGNDFLAVDRTSVHIAQSPDLWIDAAIFRDNIDAAKKLSHGARFAGILNRAINLYRGEFLSGFYLRDNYRFEAWQLGEQRSLDDAYVYALKNVFAWHRSQKQYDQSIEFGNRVLTFDPLDEQVHRDLMKIYHLMGKRSAAKHQYEECKSVLMLQLGIVPSDETEREYREIRRAWGTTVGGTTAQNAQSHKLPRRLDPLIGRERETAELRSLLNKKELRLLTLIGAGGSGKTSLGIETVKELADDYDHGIYFIDLSDVREPDRVLPAIARTLGITEAVGTKRPVVAQLVEFLDRRDLLLVIDNFEQVIAAARDIATLLSETTGPKILITSREPLRVHGENVYQVLPLSTPVQPRKLENEILSTYDSVKLFAERATAMDPSFKLREENIVEISEICIRLDGIPLAIELAASRIRSLSLQAIIARLERRLPLLSRGPKDMPERQQTLRRTMEWSYELLNENERQVFRKLAIFSGGCSLAAAEWVCGNAGTTEIIDEISSLIDKSLLVRLSVGRESRYSMLQTVKDYALVRLKGSDEYTKVAKNHAEYYRQLGERADLLGAEQIYWLDTLELERNNMRDALGTLMTSGPFEEGCKLALALRWYWTLHNYWHEALEWFERAFLVCTQVSEELKATVLAELSLSVCQDGDMDRGVALLEKSRALSAKFGDRRRTARADLYFGMIAGRSGAYSNAEERLEKSLDLARGVGDRMQTAQILRLLGDLLQEQGNIERAEPIYQESLAISRELGSRTPASLVLLGLATIARIRGDLVAAKKYVLECVELSEEMGDRGGVAVGLLELGKVALIQGRVSEAEALIKDSLRVYRYIGEMSRIACLLEGAAAVAKGLNQVQRSVKLNASASALRDKCGNPLTPADGIETRQNIAAARKSLGGEAFDALWAEGKTASMKEAVDFALSSET